MKYILIPTFLTIFFVWTQLVHFIWHLSWHPRGYREFMSEYLGD